MRVNIAILNYNGKELLRECLPSIIEAASNSVFEVRITVLDNCSTDDSVMFLKDYFPNVRVYIADKNEIYCSYNKFFEVMEDDIIFILNSDIKADKGFIDPIIRHFIDDKDVFFGASKMYYFDGITYQGDLSRAIGRFGIICADTRFKGHEDLVNKPGLTFSTGNGAFDRKKFLQLGGFDKNYLPGRYEDVDLCYRAWKAGYKGIYEPSSVIYHKGYVSFKIAYSDKDIQTMVFRNSILFMVKNFTDAGILAKFYLLLLPRLIWFIITGRLYFVKGFWQALCRLPKALKEKRMIAPSFKLRDREVLSMIGSFNG